MMQRPDDESFHKQSTPSPILGGGEVPAGETITDVVDQIKYLYVHIVKATNLDVTGCCGPYVEVRVGSYMGSTRDFDQIRSNSDEWDRVFVFSTDRIDQTSVLEMTVKHEEDVLKDDFVGWVLIDLNAIERRLPSGDPATVRCFNLKDRKLERAKGELVIAVWWGTQADRAFPEAWHSDAHDQSLGEDDGLADIRSKVYLSPKLWYLRVEVHGTNDLLYTERTRTPEVFVRASLGNGICKTKISRRRSGDPRWNDNFTFVVAEPFEAPLILSVEDWIAPYCSNDILGTCAIDLGQVERRFDGKGINTRYYNLKKDVIVEGQKKSHTDAGTLHIGIWLEGGYHVRDDNCNDYSDLRPTEERLWKKSIGVLEVGILGATGLLPMKTEDGRATTDAYCVARYGRKWARTRTIIDSFSPKWNEQYTWEVFDLCTVITIGVFDNRHLQGGDELGRVRDSIIGKVRIRLSTLETDCLYSHAYPLYALHPSGLKRSGEILLAVRFTCSSLMRMMHSYSQPLLPKMHYSHPLPDQFDSLNYFAIQIVSKRLGQANPPLRKEVVDYMLDAGSNMWSMRRSGENLYRIGVVFRGLGAVFNWFDEIRNWKHPVKTVVTHLILIILVLYPVFILPFVFLSLFSVGVWNHRRRPMHPPHIDIDLSCADSDSVNPDEVDEEFDTFPTSRSSHIVKARYDRLRSVCGDLQLIAGELASQAERLESLLSWRDPRATTMFMIFCLLAAIVLYTKPMYLVVIQTCLTGLSHPRFQHNVPWVPLNFFNRLPSRNDCLL